MYFATLTVSSVFLSFVLAMIGQFLESKKSFFCLKQILFFVTRHEKEHQWHETRTSLLQAFCTSATAIHSHFLNSGTRMRLRIGGTFRDDCAHIRAMVVLKPPFFITYFFCLFVFCIFRFWQIRKLWEFSIKVLYKSFDESIWDFAFNQTLFFMFVFYFPLF